VQKAEVAARKRIGFPEGSHGHVLCRPFSNAGNLTEPSQESFGVHDPVKTNLPTAYRTSEGLNGLGPGSRQPNAGKPGLGKDLGCGKKMRESACPVKRLAKSFYDPTG